MAHATVKIPIPEFRRHLLTWFDANARDLPWRRTSDPYPIWVSEIMLQQTRIAAVLEHYARFLSLFPSVAVLASSSEEEVLAVWSGLGYYRRAKLLHRAAQFIVRDLGGRFPRTPQELRELPGVGEYTAAAVASIAFGEPVAAVDGNVERVIQRLFLWQAELSQAGSPRARKPSTKIATGPWIRDHANALLDPKRAGDFNQSMMELGATLCLPRNPLCMACPVMEFCFTRGEHPVEPRKRLHTRQIAYALLQRRKQGSRQILLQQRSHSVSLMPGMWELPEIAALEEERERAELTLRHAITVTNYHVSVFSIPEKERRHRLPEGTFRRKWANIEDLERFPLTGVARKVLRRLKIMSVARTASAKTGSSWEAQ